MIAATLKRVAGAICIAAAFVFLPGPAQSAKDAWTFEQVEEDWGAHCTLSVELGPDSFFGFHGAPGNLVEAMLKTGDDEYPAFFQILVRAEDGKTTLLDGEMSDYFGFPTFDTKDEVPARILSRGRTAVVQLVDGPSFTIPLAGFAEASTAFDGCIRG